MGFLILLKGLTELKNFVTIQEKGKAMNNPKQTGQHSWTVEVQENGKTKELFIEFPPDCLDQVGWDVGDTLIWEELDHGGWSITKKVEPKKKSEYPVDGEITKGTRMDDNYYFFRKEEDEDAGSDDN